MYLCVYDLCVRGGEESFHLCSRISFVVEKGSYLYLLRLVDCWVVSNCNA